jgi:hypothetical protein
MDVRAALTLPRSKTIAFASGMVGFAGAFALLISIARAPHVGTMAPIALVFGALIGALVGVLGWGLQRSKEKEARLTSSDGALVHDGVVIARRGEVREGHAWEVSDGAHVQLDTKRGRVELRMRRIEDARAVLQEVGVDASKRAASFRILAPSRTNHRARLGAMIVSIPLSVALAIVLQRATGHVTPGPVFMAPYLLSVLLGVIPGRIRVGVDGVLLRWLGTSRFVPLADIEHAEVVVNEGLRKSVWVRLHLRANEAIDVMVAMPSRYAEGRTNARAQAETIVERIEEARAVARGTAGRDAANVLAREGRSAEGWLQSLRAAFARTEAFRAGPPLTLDQLWRVLEDAGARPWVRAAAAAALTSGAGDEDRKRIRVAAEATVAPKLRVALEAAAQGDDARLTDALEQIEKESAGA